MLQVWILVHLAKISIMDMVKKYFPQAFKANDVKSLIIALLIYAVIAFVGGLVIGLLGIIPIIGFIAGVLGW